MEILLITSAQSREVRLTYFHKKIVLALAVFLLLPAFAHASAVTAPANNLGLVGYWSFNEGTSTIAHDF